MGCGSVMIFLCEPKHVWSRFYNFNYFNNLRILEFACISWTMRCSILLMHGATMKFNSVRLFRTGFCESSRDDTLSSITCILIHRSDPLLNINHTVNFSIPSWRVTEFQKREDKKNSNLWFKLGG